MICLFQVFKVRIQASTGRDLKFFTHTIKLASVKLTHQTQKVKGNNYWGGD